jgi:glycerophosphoryl diester phosphodiesterase
MTDDRGPVRSAPAWLREVPLAHRGLHGPGLPENSLPAFQAAADAGYGVELDVFLSRDRVPVLLHDESLRRVAGIDAKVGDLTAEELAAIRLDGTDAGVPTLAQAMAVLREVPVMVEIKSKAVRAGQLEARTAAVLDGHPGPWCVASFNPVAVRWFRRNRPDAIRVLTASPALDGSLPKAVVRRLAELKDLPSVDPHAVSYDIVGLPSPATDRWRARGGTLITWTAVGEEGLARGRELADNVIFEDVRP